MRVYLSCQDRPPSRWFVPDEYGLAVWSGDVHGSPPCLGINAVVRGHQALKRAALFTAQIVRREPEHHPEERSKAPWGLGGLAIVRGPAAPQRLNVHDEVKGWPLGVPPESLPPRLEVAFYLWG